MEYIADVGWCLEAAQRAVVFLRSDMNAIRPLGSQQGE
jgi:hypothetical protein